MKKYLSLILICLLVLTGCGKKETSVEVLKKVLTNEKETNSAVVKARVDFKMEQDGINIDLPLELALSVSMEDEKNGNIHISLGDNPFIGELELYAGMKDKEMTMYMPSALIDMMAGLEDTESHWIVQKETLTDDETDKEFSMEEYKQNIDKIMEVVTEEDFVFVEEVDSVSHYKLKITADLIKRISEKMEEEYDSSIEDVLEEPWELDMYSKDYMITKIELDMTKILTSVMENNSIEEESFNIDMLKKLSFAIEISEYNETNVTIPENVKNAAITSEEYLRLYIGEE